jgi:para-nitrobenzyl esterase
MSSGLPPIIDGYVIPDDLYNLYESGNYNDVPVLLGNTSGEGTMFILKDKYRKYEETTHKLYGPVADKLLELYPKGNKKTTLKSMADLFRDVFFGWYAYTWATLQTKTGKAPVYVYYFNQKQPKSIITFFAKSTDAYHGSDCAYVFDHLSQNPKIKYTDEDKILSQIMVDYWINFAKYGNPNGKGLTEWPTFSKEYQIVMYFNAIPKIGTYPNIDKIKVIDEYYKWKRVEAIK